MRIDAALLALAWMTCVACSDDADDPADGDESSGGDPGSTDKSWCTCMDGGASIQVDSPAETECASICEDLGGVASIEPVVTAVGTPECDAFCAKADALGCPGSSCKSKEDFWCQASPGECLEAVQAQLQCKVDDGDFSCDRDSWQMSAPCGTFSELCSP